eukprot:TRINITY_DN3495_c0_g1_i2.p1 TRINITY_DN3495_c0_g1~~TRINITY_DN3495_c0_g1_i2.p1  ORF type:complete len:419 (-),score=100.36 TRINITY_DN3495_c0_g1_i2:107-1363(-)
MSYRTASSYLRCLRGAAYVHHAPGGYSCLRLLSRVRVFGAGSRPSQSDAPLASSRTLTMSMYRPHSMKDGFNVVSRADALDSKQESFFITGGQGFIGAWVVRKLLEENATGGHNNRVTVFDVKEDNNILGQVLTPEQLGQVKRVYGDVANTKFITDLVESENPTSIIHLAGLQIPTCKANPLLGASVNVIGTLNIFEAARLQKEKTGKAPSIAYASSAAVSGSPSDYASGPVMDDTPHRPLTHYGVFKQANEGNARVFWHDHQIASVGLRPFTVYGVGREIGLTSAPTKALKAAVLGRPYTIGFGGRVCLSYVEDVARIFVDCSRAGAQGAYALNIKGDVATVEEWIQAMSKVVPSSVGTVNFTGGELPYPVEFDESGLEALLKVPQVPTTPFQEAMQRTVSQFEKLKSAGLLHDRDL